ncbi:hypothetical protein EVAR_16085_1 [Eumeta japonica]|uniref:Uncharacterized protein n=1 Tax=Eumeta variegata TaxID=151549 RepID=A0A4C1UIC9_EUMVA|nr:hypothetical protein EVAR_16085_1 [Eumeta japonica]
MLRRLFEKRGAKGPGQREQVSLVLGKTKDSASHRRKVRRPLRKNSTQVGGDINLATAREWADLTGPIPLSHRSEVTVSAIRFVQRVIVSMAHSLSVAPQPLSIGSSPYLSLFPLLDILFLPKRPETHCRLGERISCGVVGTMMDSVFRRSSFFIKDELHMWRSEYNCDGCIFFPSCDEEVVKMHSHIRAPVRTGSVGVKPTKKVPLKI